MIERVIWTTNELIVLYVLQEISQNSCNLVVILKYNVDLRILISLNSGVFIESLSEVKKK